MRSVKLVVSSLAVLAAITVAGCSTEARRNECMAMDWRTAGYADGVAGFSGDRIAYHTNRCGKFGVTPNLDQYQTGRAQGLREFCQPANGFRYGARGNSYGGVCPAELDRKFVEAYDSGRQLYSLRSRVAQASNQLQRAHQEIDHIDNDMIRMGADMISPETTVEHRAQLVMNTKQLAERRGELKVEIPQMERDLDMYQRDLDAYRSTLRYVE